MLMLGFCPDTAENALLKATAKAAAARFDLSEWRAEFLSSLDAFMHKAMGAAQPELCCIDVVPLHAISAAKEVRSRSDRIKLLLIASPHIPPTAYIRPGIMASSLLMRPFTGEEASAAFEELISLVSGDANNVFKVETRQSSILIPYEQISYFEARERKIWLCFSGRQHAFYDTLDNLEKSLPNAFLRCHKGYIVNKAHIQSVDYTRHTLCLRHGFEVPISRSRQRAVRELYHG